MNLKMQFENLPNFRYLEESENVKAVQELLKELGYDIGPAGGDGIYGNATQKALAEFITLGKLKTNGNLGNFTKSALTELTSTVAGFKPLSWEKGSASRSNWSKLVFNTIEHLFDSSFSLCTDMEIFRKDYNTLTKTQKINVWGELISAIAYYESGWNPTSRMVETTMDTDPVTGNQVASEGLLQLSYQDKNNYGKKVEVPCNFNWALDKPLFLTNPKNPNITILNPFYNLEFGIGILAYQIKKFGKIVLTKNVYWAVIKENGKYEKINKIANFVESLKI